VCVCVCVRERERERESGREKHFYPTERESTQVSQCAHVHNYS